MNYLPIRVKRPPQSTRSIIVRIVPPGSEQFKPWLSPNAGYAGGVYTAFREKAHKTYDPNNDASQAMALVVDAALVLRKSRAAPVLEDLVQSGLVALHPTVLSSAVATGPRPALDKPILEDDWILVDVRARFPVDRARLPSWSFDTSSVGKAQGAYDPNKPYASLVAAVPNGLTWSAGREPTVPIFRIHEVPVDVFVEEQLFTRLNAALDGVLEVGRMRPNLGMLDETTGGPPFRMDNEAAEQAMAALYRGLQGSLTDGDRAQVLTSPIAAYLAAKLIDLGPADDTRRGACQHPFYAAAYARDIEQAARDDTRQAASVNEASALEYMRYVDRGPHETTRACFKMSVRQQDYELEAARAAEAARTILNAAAAPAKPEVVATGARIKSKAKAANSPDFTPLLIAGSKRANVSLLAPKACNQELVPAAVRTPTDLFAKEPTPRPRRRLRARIAGLVALGSHSDLAPFVLRRDIAENVFGALSPAEVALHPVSLVDDEGAMDVEFVWVDIRAEQPLDRDASDAVYTDPSRPHASLVKAVRAFRVDPARAPSIGIFRVGEFPGIAMIRTDLLQTLRAATGNAASTVKPPHDHLPMLPMFPEWSFDDAIDQTASDAADSAAAYYALTAGKRHAGARGSALISPIYGYWVARNVDARPADDSRAAALRHPHYAALYARWVDDAPRDDTRNAASKNAASALFYAKYVDERMTVEAERVLLRSGWGPADIKAIAIELERVRAAKVHQSRL